MSATTKRLIIGGMTCPHCQARVQQALLGVPGVARAQVSYDRGTADVTLDPENQNHRLSRWYAPCLQGNDTCRA